MVSPTARLVLLAGPPGSGKTHLAGESGLPQLDLDHFYKDRDDPTLPRHPTLGIDWDDPASWDGDGALAALEQLCRTGAADVPVYDMPLDARVGTRRVEIGDAPAFVGAGVFAAELVGPARERGLLLDAVVAHRSRAANFLRRLRRDLREHRDPPLMLVRRGLAQLRAEPGVLARQVALGCRPCDRDEILRSLRTAAARAAPPPSPG